MAARDTILTTPSTGSLRHETPIPSIVCPPATGHASRVVICPHPVRVAVAARVGKELGDKMNMHQKASVNILALIAEGQMTWRVDDLLYAASGEHMAEFCSTELMPKWMAKCTDALSWGVPEGSFPKIAERYGKLIGQWGVLTPDDWYDVRSAWMAFVMDEALSHVSDAAKFEPYWPAVEVICAHVKAFVLGNDGAEQDDTMEQIAWNRWHSSRRDRRYPLTRAKALDATWKAAQIARTKMEWPAIDVAFTAETAAQAARSKKPATYERLFTALLNEIERAVDVKTAS